MMGFEPTTFCMASRRSSQLSYIREARRIIAARLRSPTRTAARPRRAASAISHGGHSRLDAKLIPGTDGSAVERSERDADTRGCHTATPRPPAGSEGAGVEPDPVASRTLWVSTKRRTVRRRPPTTADVAAPEIATPDVRLGRSAVERLVDETVGEFVVLPADRAVRDLSDLAREACGLHRKLP